MTSRVLLLLGLCLYVSAYPPLPNPEQVHVTFGSSSEEYVVSWVTFERKVTTSIVEYGSDPSSLSLRATTNSNIFNNTCGVSRALHDVLIPVKHGDTIFYRVSSGGTFWSEILTFTAVDPKPNLTVSLLGDMGINCGTSSVPQLIDDTDAQVHELVIHYGDIAYNIDDQCGNVGDLFMNAVSPFASRIPVVFGVGNHETSANFTYIDYLQRYAGQKYMAAAAGSSSVRYLSFDVGLVHFALVDTDAWIYEPVYPQRVPNYNWLEKDLQAVDRNKTPWLILIGHRAMYCDLDDTPECNAEAETIRYGVNGSQGLEALMLKYGVDMYFAGHTHHYQREWPVARGNLIQANYTNPRAPVHIQSGIAGVDGGEAFMVPKRAYTAYRDEQLNIGFSRIIVQDASTLVFQQVYAVNGTVLDTFTLTQHRHGPFTWLL